MPPEGRALMALIHHIELWTEADVPDVTVRIWRKSGWQPGPLPRFSPPAGAPVASPPADESSAPEPGESPITDQEV